VPISLLFGDIVRFTAHPYLQVYSDKNCPTYGDIKADADSEGKEPGNSSTYKNEMSACTARDGQTGANGVMLPQSTSTALVPQDPRTRFVSARFMLQAVLEIAVTENVNIFLLFEGDPVGQRQALTAKFSSLFPAQDPQIYGRAGITFKF
jgi:hypothetical protein